MGNLSFLVAIFLTPYLLELNTNPALFVNSDVQQDVIPEVIYRVSTILNLDHWRRYENKPKLHLIWEKREIIEQGRFRQIWSSAHDFINFMEGKLFQRFCNNNNKNNVEITNFTPLFSLWTYHCYKIELFFWEKDSYF